MDEGSAKKVDTIAQFWLANQGDRLQRMQKWQFLHPTPYPEPISKDVYHDLFEYLGLNEGIVQNYFLARAKRCHKEDAVAFDSSTVSSYSRYIKETRQGCLRHRKRSKAVLVLKYLQGSNRYRQGVLQPEQYRTDAAQTHQIPDGRVYRSVLG